MKLTLKRKLIGIFLLIGLIPVTLVGFLLYRNAEREIRGQVYDSISIHTHRTTLALEEYWEEKESEATTIANMRDVEQSLSVLVQLDWDIDNPSWEDRITLLNFTLPNLVKDYGFSMAYITDPDGRVIYSTLDDLPLGKDLSSEDFIQAGLSGQTSWSELHYSDILEEYSLTISVPVSTFASHGGIEISSFNLILGQKDIERIIFQGLESLGDSADSYLIAADGLLFSNTYLGEYASDSILQRRLDTEIVDLFYEEIKDNEEKTYLASEYINHYQLPVLGQVNISRLGDTPIGLVVEISQEEVFANILSLRNNILFILLIVCVSTAIIGSLIAKNIAKPIIDASFQAEILAKGDFTQNIHNRLLERKDEIGILATALKEMRASLRKMINGVSQSAENTSFTSKQLSSSVQQNSLSIEAVLNSSEEMFSSAQEISASLEEFTLTTENLSKNTEEMANTAADINELADDGLIIMGKTEEEMQQILESSRKSIETIQELNDASEEINTVVDIISRIAKQTNLLALNAAIEAARAGEQGKSFAVVAEEIRDLSVETEKSTVSIRERIGDLNKQSRKTAVTIKNNNIQIESGAKIMDETGEAFKTINKKIANMVSQIQGISGAVEELSASSEEIASVTEEQARKSEEVTVATEEQSAAIQEISASAHELSEMAQSLEKLFGQFKI
ncbi:methyl-accepting chemotaxis protein [Natronospora cellulosivora (SeqCode)]